MTEVGLFSPATTFARIKELPKAFRPSALLINPAKVTRRQMLALGVCAGGQTLKLDARLPQIHRTS